MVITHDKYMTLQSLVVLHLSATERETGRGIDRDELIDWYLELKESEIQDVEELEYEKETDHEDVKAIGQGELSVYQ
jgi:DNA replication licensing factor MCM6